MLNSTKTKAACKNKWEEKIIIYIFVYIESQTQNKNHDENVVYLFAIGKFRDVSMWRKKNTNCDKKKRENIWEKNDKNERRCIEQRETLHSLSK